MVALVKLGGSVLTDRRTLFSFRAGLAARLAAEIRQSGQVPVIVAGTGRAGKAFARHYTGPGRSTADPGVYQLTTAAIRALGDRLGRALRDEGVPHCLLPAAALVRRRGARLEWHAGPAVSHLLSCGVAPVLCGDVLPEDRNRFGIVSSDELVPLLAAMVTGSVTGPVTVPVSGSVTGSVHSCVFVTDVDGVLGPDGRLLPEVGEDDAPPARDSDRADVTGGMSAKLSAAVAAARTGAAVTIVNGQVPGRLRDALRGRPVTGTRVLARAAPSRLDLSGGRTC